LCIHKYICTAYIIKEDRIFKKKQSYELSPNILWDALQKDTVFIEFVSTGAIKSVGDLFQEVNSVAQLAGYDSSRITPRNELEHLTKKINGEFRVGANGDRPSGVRAGYMLLKSISGINDKSMAGYFSTGVGPFAIRSDIQTVFSEVVPQAVSDRVDMYRPEEVDLQLLRVEQLRQMLKDKGIPITGLSRKTEFIKRLSGVNGGTRKSNKLNQRRRVGRIEVFNGLKMNRITRKYIKNS
jgi:hypothetical protein